MFPNIIKKLKNTGFKGNFKYKEIVWSTKIK